MNIEHIKTIVSSQQSLAKHRGAVETVSLDRIVEDAVDMHEVSFERAGVNLVCEYAHTPAVAIDRHKVMQIVINFLSNARQALEKSAAETKKVVIKTEVVDGEVHVSVADTGIGISENHLEKVFNHGFTTKEDGHGFGLHSSANAATECGGSISCHSDGVGTGATFTFRIPVETEERAA